jgi:4-amino-4-deoxy-L-arabinose transferase-like glycosyltransferase
MWALITFLQNLTVKQKTILYFFFLFVIVFSNNHLCLWDQDEAAYAGYAKNMMLTDNWLIPDFMWSEDHRKTPLHFWNIAISYNIFGINEFAVRFPSSLFLFLTYFLVFSFVKKVKDEKTALLSVVILSTTLFIPTLGKVSVTDSTLFFLSVLCAYSIWHILYEKSLKWSFIFWISFSIALLVKGPPIIIFTGIFISILVVFHPQRKNIVVLHPWFFLPLALLPFTIWAYQSTKFDNGVFLQWLFDWYVKKRINDSVFGQTGYPGTHFVLLIIIFLPWIKYLIKAFKSIFFSLYKKRDVDFFLSAWFISGWLIYEFSPSKLPSYIVVAHVPIAVFIAGFVLNKLYNNNKNTIRLLLFNISLQAVIWLAALPLIENIRNVSKRVGIYLSKNVDSQTTIYLANKRFSPPSLPFYIGQHHTNVVSEKDLLLLSKYYYKPEPCVFVLSETQANILKSVIPNMQFHKISAPEYVLSLSNSYYIFIKEQKNDSLLKTDETSFILNDLATYRANIVNNQEWYASVKERAIKANMTTDELVFAEAIWVRQKDSLKADYLIYAKQNLRHKSEIETKAIQNQISFEEQALKDADFLFENRYTK